MKKTFIIGEVGINHNGSLLNALKLINGAKEAGADAVKFQKRDINSCYSKEELDKPREHPFGEPQTNRRQKEALEFSEKEYDEIDKHCRKVGIEWFFSPWDLKSVEFMTRYDLNYNKIASPMLRHKELLEAVAKQRKYTFISTGMSNHIEINDAIKIFQNHNCKFELMHCNSQYPLPDNRANLKMIPRLKEIYGVDVGYSGHEVGLITSVAAVAIGATSIERHLTLDRAMYGSDQAASVEIQGLKRLIEYIRVVESALGDDLKIITNEEEACRKKLSRERDYNG